MCFQILEKGSVSEILKGVVPLNNQLSFARYQVSLYGYTISSNYQNVS